MPELVLGSHPTVINSRSRRKTIFEIGIDKVACFTFIHRSIGFDILRTQRIDLILCHFRDIEVRAPYAFPLAM